jgi:capsular polysaccharide biosynthesis protein
MKYFKKHYEAVQASFGSKKDHKTFKIAMMVEIAVGCLVGLAVGIVIIILRHT